MNLFRNWTTADFEREADEFCKLAFYNYGVELDYTPDTVRQLENIMAENFAAGAADDHPALIVSMGCYVGEVIVRTFGGQWQANEEFFKSPAVVIEGKLQTAGLSFDLRMYLAKGTEDFMPIVEGVARVAVRPDVAFGGEAFLVNKKRVDLFCWEE